MKGRFWWGVVAALCGWNAYDHLTAGNEHLRGASEAVVALLLVIGLIHDAYTARAARRLTDDFGAYLRAREDRAGVTLVRRGTDGTWLPQHAHNADEKFPLASTRKVLILCALSERIHQGTVSADERLPLREVRRFHLPGTDGGAFAQAYPDAGRRTEISIRDCADAMIHRSCNASAEYLWRRVGGRPALAALARRHHMDAQGPVYSGYGEFVAALAPFLPRTCAAPTTGSPTTTTVWGRARTAGTGRCSCCPPRGSSRGSSAAAARAHPGTGSPSSRPSPTPRPVTARWRSPARSCAGRCGATPRTPTSTTRSWPRVAACPAPSRRSTPCTPGHPRARPSWPAS